MPVRAALLAALALAYLAAGGAQAQGPATAGPDSQRRAGAGAATARPAARLNRDPDAARLVTADVPRFWAAYDRATLADAALRFQRDYLDAGTPGLRDYAGGGRIGGGRQLAAAVAARPRYYAAVRAGTLALDTSRALTGAVRAGFRRLKALYPDAVFPDVYFVVGRLQSGGTTSPRGLLIGAEMYAADARTPLDELTAWERSVVHPVADLPALVVHELVHHQQVPDTGRVTLLARALREGGADFLTELAVGAHANHAQRAYGDAHEAALWAEFAPAMRGTDAGRWLYGASGTAERPPDLGYYVGYRIARAYYGRAGDKAAALRTLMLADAPERVLAESGYAPASAR